MQFVQGRQPILSIHWCGATSGAVLWLEGLTCATLGAWTQMTSAREAPMQPAQGRQQALRQTCHPATYDGQWWPASAASEAAVRMYPQMAMTVGPGALFLNLPWCQSCCCCSGTIWVTVCSSQVIASLCFISFTFCCKCHAPSVLL